MESLIIENFLIIKYAEIEIKKLMLSSVSSPLVKVLLLN